MKRILMFCLIGLIAFTPSCALFTNPFHLFEKAQTKVNITKTELQNNQDSLVMQAANMTWAANETLNQDPTPNKYTTVAKQFTSRASEVLGSPSLDDVNKLRLIITNLLSENTKLIIQGEHNLAQYDKQVTALQSEKKELENNLQSKQQILDKVSAENSKMAETWSRIKKIFYWGAILLGLMFLIRTLAAVCPPPYNSVASIVGAPFTLLVKGLEAFFPECIKLAGWVESEYKTATEDLVSSIQKIKTSNPELHNSISTVVATTVSDTAVPVINQAKATQGIVS